MNRIRITLSSVFGAALAFALTTTAGAQEVDAEAEGVGGGVTSFGLGDWFGLGLRLALVIAVIWGGVTAMRWYVRKMNGAGRRGGMGALEVLETHALGPNRTLHLVRVGGRAVLVGATPERITQLLTVDDPEDLELLVSRPDDTPTRALATGMPSILASFGKGMTTFRAMNDRRRAMTGRLQEQRAARQMEIDAIAETPKVEKPSRFAALRQSLATPARPTRSVRPRRVEAEPVVEQRQSLFERTLASIDAIEITSGVNAADGLRARTGYGQAPMPSSTSTSPRAAASAQRAREAQIANLQRAITAARKNAG